MQLFYGVPEDIDKWMNIVTRIRWNFPGLETQEKLDEHRATVLRFMGKRQSICVKEENEIAGVMLFSRGHNMICCLAVSPKYRRRGVASMLMDEALNWTGQKKYLFLFSELTMKKVLLREHYTRNTDSLKMLLLKNWTTRIRSTFFILRAQNKRTDRSLSIKWFGRSVIFF